MSGDDVSISIRYWVQDIHETAKSKGWWDTPRSALDCHMLMVSELAEATEEARKATPPIYQEHHVGPNDPETYIVEPDSSEWDTSKPEGELTELADCVIRIMDYCGFKGWDLEKAIALKHEYNKTREFRHGGKKF